MKSLTEDEKQAIRDAFPWKEGIEHGYCNCGCGEKTNLAPYTVRSQGYIKDEPHRYIRGHDRRTNNQSKVLNLCACGCGELTAATFKLGHNARVGSPRGRARRTKAELLAHIRATSTTVDLGYETPCRIWDGTRIAKTGYAMVGWQGRCYTAHRLLYVLSHDLEYPHRQMHVHHKCENRACVELAHLELVPAAENTRLSRKMTPFTPHDIRIIRASHKSAKELAEFYSVHHGTIRQIRNRRRWANLD